MQQAIQELMEEHRIIEQVLGALETFAFRLQSGEISDRSALCDFAAFFREFADKLHHGKEEDRLFTEMERNGFPRECGPIGVMLAEHVEGRGHVRALADLGEGEGPLDAAERQTAARHALAYVPLLRGHILKEDNVLYPMALQAVAREDLEALAAAFAQFEAEVLPAGDRERLLGLADTLVQRFPPDPARAAAGDACLG
jgi:hemerythrin-like domain-containing protein